MSDATVFAEMIGICVAVTVAVFQVAGWLACIQEISEGKGSRRSFFNMIPGVIHWELLKHCTPDLRRFPERLIEAWRRK